MKNAGEQGRARLEMVLAVAIFGTIGIFRHYMPFASGFMAMVRGLVGAGFLLALNAVRRRKTPAVHGVGAKTRALLVLSGAMIGFNWILLFEAYRYTTVATATLCYYMAPVIVLLLSPVLLHEYLSARKGVCAALAVVGMVLVSGIVGQTGMGAENGRGIALGLGAAALYASVILLNKRLDGVSAETRTVYQLFSAGAVLVPYVLLAERGTALPGDVLPWVLLAVVSVVHTGIAYALYFASMKKLPAQSVALLSYIDPVLAVVLSLVLLREPMTAAQGCGAVLLLAAMLVSDVLPEKSTK